MKTHLAFEEVRIINGKHGWKRLVTACRQFTVGDDYTKEDMANVTCPNCRKWMIAENSPLQPSLDFGVPLIERK